jgi:hypothetical protein
MPSPAGKRVVVLESRLLGSGQTGRSLGDMTSWHTGLFSSLERWTSRDQRQQVGSLQSVRFVLCFVVTVNALGRGTRVMGAAHPVPLHKGRTAAVGVAGFG